MGSFADTLPTPPAHSDAPFSLPLAHPEPSAKPVPPKDLTPDQETKLEQLVARFNQPDFRLPNSLRVLKALWAKEPGGGGGSRFGGLFSRSATPSNEELSDVHPLNDVEKCYWSRQAFLRCFRATKWDYDAARKRAEETLVWRREYGVEDMKEEDVAIEGETGKEIVFGYDVNCRPVLYMHPYRQNTETGPRQIAFVVWCLERTIDLAPPTDPATEMLCLCIDFGASRNAKSQPTTLGQARKVLEILQTYYCERLGKAVCVDIPQIFFAFYKLVSPFVDPITKEKIRFLDKPDATALIPPSQLQKIFGGDINLEYNHKEYFPALTKLCFERKAANLERWRKYGDNKCGLDEAIIRGGRVPGEAPHKLDVAAAEADVEAGTSPEDAVRRGGEGEEQSTEPPTEELAAASIADEQAPASTAASSNGSAATVAVPETPGVEDKFVDAPVASTEAVEKAAPAV
ncbi:CRAL-TRIO domain-containing protein [Rhodotorula paludigena]|uniref:CRAL-TRIO domain-containing protein n=1 Tax=Rhodotorula paludigena TaxID=86838 RepID=UPI003179AAB2